MTDIQEFIVNVGTVGTSDGSSLVRLGGTCVLCGIKAELASPPVNQQSQGSLVANVNLSALSSPLFRPGPPNEEAQSLSQWLHDVCNESALLDMEQLCIAPGKLCWVLYADITCLNYDGSLPQACLAALVAALKNLRLPTIEIAEDSQRITPSQERSVTLKLQCVPVAVSFALLNDEKVVCCPSGEEENVSAAVITVATCDEERLCSVTKLGGTAASCSVMRQCCEKALRHGDTIRTVLETPIASSRSNVSTH